MPRVTTQRTGRSAADVHSRLDQGQAAETPHRQQLVGMSYAEGAAYLAPVQMEPDPSATTTAPPTYSDTATTTLNAQMSDDDYELEDLCYMDTHNRMVTILREYKTGLESVQEPDSDGSRAQEIARINRIVGYLEYAQKIVPNNRNRNADVTSSEAAKAAFPDLTPTEAKREAKRLYHIASTQPSAVRRAPTTFRGAGVGGALAKMGGAEIIYREEIAAGKLKPGAPLQYWNGQSVYLHGRTDAKQLDGKGVYQAIVANKVDTSQQGGIYGHSITFVGYGASNNIIQTTDYNGTLNEYDVNSNSPYFIGANVSTGGEATNAAEYVLQGTGFQADKGQGYIAAKAAKYNLDAGKLAALLIAGIDGSGHASLTKIKASVSHHGTPTAFDHTMARLIGLWQYAVMGSADGLFGPGSCKRLTGKTFKDATAIQISAPPRVAGPTNDTGAG